ncbi:MAG: CPBP family intramembrane metalloprotease [Peptostreptococcaceae bacterium]|nr:CPBP family intramembrane metalloprotease [Peptostreptococcaceae bacterium]
MEEMIKRPSHRFEFLILAFLIPLTYDRMEELFYNIVYDLPSFDPEVIGEMVSENYYFFDALFCLTVLAIYLPWFLILRRRERYQTSMEPKEPIRFSGIIQWTVITLGLSGISLLWLTMVEDLTVGSDILGLGESLESFNETWSPGTESYIWTFLSVVTVGPIVEELMFRGLQFWYVERIGRGWFVILFTGISFGLWHGEPVQVVYTAIMGIALAIIYDHTRSLIPPLFIHILNNFISALPPALDTQEVYHVLDIACMICILPTLWMIFRMLKKTRRRRVAAQIEAQAQEIEVAVEIEETL